MTARPLEGKVALVTGASRGIGASTAAHLARLGARLALVARSGEGLARVAQAVAELESEALCLTCDLSDPGASARAFRVASELGPIEVLVNNAACLRLGPFVEQGEEDWEAMRSLNLDALLRCVRLVLPSMIERRRGVVINVASVAGVAGVPKLPGLVGYAATKGAVIAFSEALAAEVAPHGVRVLSVSPGSVKTEMLKEAAPEAHEEAMTPGQVGRVIAQLACNDFSAVQGSNHLIWGPPTTS